MLMRSWVRFLALALAFPVSAQTAAPKVFRITPVRPVAELIREAKAASPDRKSTRLNSSHIPLSRMPSSA